MCNYRPDVDELENLVMAWAVARNLYNESTPETRIAKVREEVDELDYALQWESKDNIRLEAGDVLVTLINTLLPLGISLRSALHAAYKKIEHRTGHMENGTFVKDKS